MITGFRAEPVQDVDAMWEADAAAEWERLNAPDEHENEYKDAAEWLKKAIEELTHGIDKVLAASDCVRGIPCEDRILSFHDELDDIATDLNRLQKQLEKGWYE